MYSRALRIFAALFWMLWFAAVAPLHRRGIIALDDSAAGGASCCEHTDHSHPSPVTPAQKCAICFTIAIAGTDAPSQLADLAPRESRQIADEFSPACFSCDLIDLSRCRGPPMS